MGVLFNVPLRGDYGELLAAVREALRPLRELGLEVWLAGLQTIDAATRDHLTADLPLLLVVSGTGDHGHLLPELPLVCGDDLAGAGGRYRHGCGRSAA